MVGFCLASFTVWILWLRLDVMIEKLGQLTAALETTQLICLSKQTVGLNHTVLLRPFQFAMDCDSKSKCAKRWCFTNLFCLTPLSASSVGQKFANFEFDKWCSYMSELSENFHHPVVVKIHQSPGLAPSILSDFPIMQPVKHWLLHSLPCKTWF